MARAAHHEEARAIGRGAYAAESDTENALRRELGLPARDSHGSLCATRPATR
jgi:hypothetical protein